MLRKMRTNIKEKLTKMKGRIKRMTDQHDSSDEEREVLSPKVGSSDMSRDRNISSSTRMNEMLSTENQTKHAIVSLDNPENDEVETNEDGSQSTEYRESIDSDKSLRQFALSPFLSPKLETKTGKRVRFAPLPSPGVSSPTGSTGSESFWGSSDDDREYNERKDSYFDTRRGW